MSSSLIPSRCFTSARSELPWAATSTVRPGAQVGDDRRSSQYGSIRATTSLRHSVRGMLVAEVRVARVARLATTRRRRPAAAAGRRRSGARA